MVQHVIASKNFTVQFTFQINSGKINRSNLSINQLKTVI
jgi:hypothetical protein